MRILHITSRLVSGGAARNLLNVIEWERRHGHEVSVAVGVDHEPALHPYGIPVHVVPTLVREVNPAADVRALRDLRGIVAGRSYDVVHTHLAKGGILGRIAARGQARVLTHTVHAVTFGVGFGRVPSLAYLTAERYCARFTDVFAVVGVQLKWTYANAGIGSEHCYHIIRSPVDIDAFLATRSWAASTRAAMRSRFGLPVSGQLVVGAGRLERVKRCDLLISAITPLLRRRALTLVLAGKGPEEAALRAQARRLGVAEQVIFLGHTDRLPQLLANADIFAHTSAAEGVPQVVLQALAAGVPVVATEVEGLREIEHAPITIVPHTGSGLTNALGAVLARGKQTVLPAEAFLPWSTDAVAGQIAAFHQSLERRLAFSSQRQDRPTRTSGSGALR